MLSMDFTIELIILVLAIASIVTFIIFLISQSPHFAILSLALLIYVVFMCLFHYAHIEGCECKYKCGYIYNSE